MVGHAMTVTIASPGLESLATYFETMPEITARSAKLAINTVTKGPGMTAIKTAMRNEINFPSGYLNSDRLRVTRLASESNLESVIVGRKRATSLARFVSGAAIPNSKRGGGVSVRVKSGRTSYLKSAFLVRLKSGASLSEDNYNLGLAVRLKPGETIGNKNTQHKAWLVPGRVALLYGPSVDQVFGGVLPALTPKIADLVEAEFFRQFARASSGK